MLNLFRRSPLRRLHRAIARSAQSLGALRVEFDGARAIVTCTETGTVVASQDVSGLLEHSGEALEHAIDTQLRKWLATCAENAMDITALLPLVRRIPRNLGASEPWSQPIGGDLCLYAAHVLSGALVPVSEPVLSRHGLGHSAIRPCLEANWVSRETILDIRPRPDGLVELAIRDIPELTASLLICPSLPGLVRKLGWTASALVLVGRDRMLLANGTDAAAPARLKSEQARWGDAAISAQIWEVRSQGTPLPLSAAA